MNLLRLYTKVLILLINLDLDCYGYLTHTSWEAKFLFLNVEDK